MSITQKLSRLLCGAEDRLFEVHMCLSCDVEILDGSRFQLCKKCQSGLTIIGKTVCQICGEDLSGEENVMVCDICKDKKFNFDQNRSFCYYGEVSSNIIKHFKYGGRRYYAKFLAKIMCENSKIFEGVDVMTFVPVSRSTKAERGFNQAEELAKEISKLTNIPVRRLLTKSRAGRHQAKLSQSERLKNLQDSFSPSSEASTVKGKRVLIIDDVFTTGTTLSECAKALKKFKPTEIFTYTFAKTDFNLAKI